MPANEFEKKIISEMEGLKLKPSEEVWDKVEERIRKKKKRRGLIIIFFLLGLALLGYWQRGFLSGEKDPVAVTDVQKDSPMESPKTIEEKTEVKQTSPVEQSLKKPSLQNEELNNKENKTVIKNSVEKKSTVEKNNSVPVEKSGNNEIKKKKQDQKKSTSVKGKETESVVKQSKPEVIKEQKEKAVSENSVVFIEEKQKETAAEPVQKNQPDSAAISNDIVIQADQNKPDTISLQQEMKPDSSLPVVNKQSTSKKWKWGFHISPGISSLNNGISIGGMKSADALYSQVSSGSGNYVPPNPPADSKPGFAIQAGAFLQKQISKRSLLSVGLQYAYYSEVLKLGMRKDSVLNSVNFSSAMQDASRAYGAGGNMVKVTNSYHFIELPVIYHLQLNKSKTHPSSLDLGLKLGQLLATNALVYDTAFGGIYYNNNDLFNKTQFSLSTGINWTVINKKGIRWTIGPVVDFYFTRFLDNPFEKSKFISYTGVRSAVIFPGKK